MSTEAYSHIQWTELELRGVLEDEDSCVRFQRSVQHFAIRPYELNDIRRTIKQLLKSKVNFYDSQLRGLVLAYKNPKLVESLGKILHDSPDIHIDIEADFYIFEPRIGCTLKGIANKKADNHLGLLVHKAFNVSIPKADDCEEWLGDYVFVGQEVKLKVTHLDFNGKLPFIRGELEPDVTMGRIYYDRINNELHEQTAEGKPRNLSIIEETGDLASKRKNKSKEQIFIDFKNESLDSEISDGDYNVRPSQNTSKAVQEGISGKSEIRKSDESSDDLGRIKRSRKKLEKIGDRNKLICSNVWRSQKTSESETEGARTKAEILEKESADNVDKKPIIIISDSTMVAKGKETNGVVVKESPSKGNKLNKNAEERETDDVVKSLLKRHKKNRVTDSDDERSTDVDAKSAIIEEESEKVDETKKSRKRKKEKSRSKEEEAVNTDDERSTDVDVKSVISVDTNFLIVGERGRADKSKKGSKNIKKERKSNKAMVVDSDDAQSTDIDDVKSGINVDSNMLIEEETKKMGKESRVKEELTEDIKKEKRSEGVETDDGVQKKKIKRKKRIKEEEREEEKEEEDRVQQDKDDDDFAFVKPDLDAFETSPKKLKRKRRKNITEAEEESSTGHGVVDDNNKAESEPSDEDFFRDVRIKIEPDPSDIEDFGPSKKEKKRKRKDSLCDNNELDTKKRRETTFYDAIVIKQETDMSDNEISKKKKKKKSRQDVVTSRDIKIKREPETTSVVNRASPPPAVKSERRESLKFRLESPKKET